MINQVAKGSAKLRYLRSLAVDLPKPCDKGFIFVLCLSRRSAGVRGLV